MPYRAGPGSGMFSSYAFPDTRPKIDVGGVIDAFTGGASSLIHGAYIRQRQKMLDQQARDQIAYQHQRDQIADTRYEQARQDRIGQQDREFGLKAESERHRFIEAGGIPASTTVDTTPNTTDISSGFKPNLPTSLQPNAPAGAGGGIGTDQSPIARAMTAGVPTSVAPTAAPTAAEVPSRATTTPESFDPTRSAAYERGVAVQQIRNDGYVTRDEARQEFQTAQQQARLDAQQRGREYMAGQALTRLKASLAARGATGKGGTAMTGGQAELARQRAATGLLDQMGGSYDAAVSALNGPDGEQFRNLGVEPRHLMYAHSQYVSTATTRALRLQSGLTGMTPEQSKAAIDSTRKLVGGSQPPAASGPTSPPPSTSNAPTAPVPKRLARPGTPAAPTDKGTAPGSSSSGDDFTDDEVKAAYTAGMRTDKDITAWIIQRRRKKVGTA
jgi:hypothetical protein